jgi:hypothetical protein
MGGWGSGRWGYHQKKVTVESCAFLEVQAGGRIAGVMPRGHWRSESVTVGDTRHLKLFGEREGWVSEQSIEVLLWKPRLGGQAIWLLCPRCERRCRKLFAPPRMVTFRCRICWKLSYQSSQEAHRWDRGLIAQFLAPMTQEIGCSLQDVEKTMRAEKRNR